MGDSITIEAKMKRRQRKHKAVEDFNPIEVNGEVLMHVDATPDQYYPIRILRAHRANCNCVWTGSNDVLMEYLNSLQKDRAKLLDEALRLLEDHILRS